MGNDLELLIQNFSYFAVFVGVAIESFGIPFPGETILLLASAYAANSHLSIIYVIVIAALGAIIGDSGGYWIGREYGRKLISKHGSLFHFTKERQIKIENYFKKYGAWTVFVGRFISILRTYSAFFAGINKMNYSKFFISNGLGGIFWSVLIGLLGFFFGSNLTLISKVLKDFSYGIIAILLLILFVIFYKKKLQKENENNSKTKN